MKRWILIFSGLLLLFTIQQKWPLTVHQLRPVQSQMPNLKNVEAHTAIDPESQLYYFFHSHREAEAGHFHIFFTDEDHSIAHHVIGASINDSGALIKLFVPASWVTDEEILPAEDVLKRIHTIDENCQALPWIVTLLKTHSHDIEELLTFRDKLAPARFGRYEIIAEKEIQQSPHVLSEETYQKGIPPQ